MKGLKARGAPAVQIGSAMALQNQTCSRLGSVEYPGVVRSQADLPHALCLSTAHTGRSGAGTSRSGGSGSSVGRDLGWCAAAPGRPGAAPGRPGAAP
jgi:hypothetical protein